jgi:hypothetical protein
MHVTIVTWDRVRFWLIHSYRKNIRRHSNITPQVKEPCLKASLLICSQSKFNSLIILSHLTVVHVNARQMCEAVHPWTPQPAWHTPNTKLHQNVDAIYSIVVNICQRVRKLLFHSITELFFNPFIQILWKVYYKINLNMWVYIFTDDLSFEIISKICFAGIQENWYDTIWYI